MKTHNIIYKNNKFYDKVTCQRVHPKEGYEFIIAGDDNNFGDFDVLNQPHEEISDAIKKLEEIKKLKNIDQYEILLPSGSTLDFHLSITKTKHRGEDEFYEFRLQLLEDLYLYKCNSWSKEKLPELYNCRCVVFEDLLGNVKFFEPIYANSVNEAYSKTRQFYFPNQGTPGTNIYLIMSCSSMTPQKTLKDLRQLFIDKLAKKEELAKEYERMNLLQQEELENFEKRL